MSIWETALGILGGGVLGGGSALGVWLKSRAAVAVERERADSAEAVAKATAGAAVSVEDLRQVPGLITTVRQLMSEKDECKETLHTLAVERIQERADDAQACREETARQVQEAEARVRADLGIVAARQLRADPDSTGVHHLRDLVRRSPTPTSPIAAQPDTDTAPPDGAEKRTP